MNDQQTDIGLLEFIKYILSDMVSKITVVITNQAENTNQVKNLTTIISQPPTRNDVIEKINIARQEIIDEIDSEIVKRLNDREKDYFNINVFIRDLNTITLKLSTQIDDNAKTLDKLNTKLTIALQVAAAVMVIIPIIWGIFEFVSKVSIHK